MKSNLAITLITDAFDKKIWNDAAVHPLQSWQWGETRKKMGIEILRIGEFVVGNRHAYSLRNVYQLTFHKIPFTKYKIGYLPRSKFPSKDVFEFLYDYGKKNNVIFIKIEPYEQISNIKYQKSKTHIKNQNLLKSKHPLFPAWTQIIDLTKSADELLKNMHPKTRYNMRLAQKKGVIVKELSNNEGFEIFAKLYFETCKRQKYFGHTYAYHKIIWENLREEIGHILVAFYQNIPLAAFELFHFRDTLYYPYGGTSLQYRNFMASNLLMWESIRFGKKLGAKKFDLWGSLPPNYDTNNSWAGFTRFKEGYGGEFVELIGSYDLIIDPFLFKFYSALHSLRSLYLNFKRIF